MNGTGKKVLLGACGSAAAAVLIHRGISRAFDRKMVGAALDRREPKALGKKGRKVQGSNLRDEEIMAHCRRMQQKLEAAPHQVIHIRGQDGTTLVGHLFRVEGAKRVVLAMHGWRSCWARDFGAIGDFLRDTGSTVLYAEQRGQGRSGGEYMGFGMVERFDCLEWVRWLNSAGFAASPIYLAGISMGASTVLMASGFPELPENVAGIIADCGFTSARAEWQHISEHNLHMPYRRRRGHIDALCRRKIAVKPDAYSTLDAMKACRRPILFIHGADDTFVPVAMTLENYAACQAPKQLLIVPGAGHGMSYFYDRAGYEKAIRQFFREHG